MFLQRNVMAVLALVFSFSAAIGGAFSAEKPLEEPVWKTATTLTDPPKYQDHFSHYDYVNPDAPKGGVINLIALGHFSSLNPYIVQGEPPAGLAPFGGGLLYDMLMDQSMDQGGVSYGNLAEAMMEANDQSWVKFRLNPKAHWHDGQPITVDDVVWSFEQLRKISPYYRTYYSAVDRVEISGEREITFRFKMAGNRELPKIMGDLVVLPKHWWEGTDKDGKKRDITKPTLEIPLGSGLYKIASFTPGKAITWQRVPDAWAVNLPQNIGRYNYDELRYSYLTDPTSVWEAFKKGGMVDYRLENDIQKWMQNYTFPAFNDGRVKRISYPAREAGQFQAYYINTRLKKFEDVRVRQAISLALDFEKMNRLLYFNQYHRIDSYYGNQIVSARGLPQGRELEVLEKVRDKVPEVLFHEPFKQAVYDGEDATRTHLTKAMNLLLEAGWTLENNRLVDKKGEPFTIEFLLVSPIQQRATALYVANLKRLGIDAKMRVVDAAQYTNRRNDFDFDMIMEVNMQSNSPGNEQIDFFGSSTAMNPGSRNFSGVRNEAVDALIAMLIEAQTREDVVAISRAIDRVLLWNYYSVPNWASNSLNIAYWDKFGMPEKQPAYAGFDFLSFWIDPVKAEALEKKQ